MRQRKILIPHITRVCKGCGIKFFPKDGRQKYHDEDCREEYYTRHYFAKLEVEKTCPNCGTVFSTSKPKKQVYCEPDCREDARVKRADALKASRSAEKVTYLSERVAAFGRDGFRCTICGRGPKDGAVLDVVEEGANLVTVCTDCKIGKEVKQE